MVAPPPDLTVSQWADAKRRLSAEASAEPGRWNTDRAPYQRGIMDAVNESGIHTIIGMTSAQVGKTEIILNIIGYFVDQDPAPMLCLQPTLEMAETFSKDRIAPMVRDTPALREKFSKKRARDSNNTLLHKKFSGGHVTLAGANSPASLASRPVRFVLCDEVDRYPPSAGTEGDPVSLAKKRTSTFYNRLAALFSTPTIKGTSRIEAAWNESDQRRYHMPCPHCKELITLKFSRLKWDDGKPETVVYLCDECDAIIDESHKPKMLALGQWIKGRPEVVGIAGFHLNELYSPWRKWFEVVADFLSAKKSPETLKTWVNTALGEPWEQKGDAPEWRKLYDRREQYPIGTVPKGGLLLVAGGDVQKDRIEVEIVAYGRGKESWSVDYRVFTGDTAQDDVWKEAAKLLDEEWPHESGHYLSLECLAIDSGFRTQKVYDFVRKYPGSRVIAVKGKESAPMIISTPKKVDVTSAGKTLKRGVRVWHVGTDKTKEELYGWLDIQKPTDSELELTGGEYPVGFCHFPEYGEEYFKMLTSEQLVLRMVKGRPVYRFEKVYERNEALDVRVYSRAAAALKGLDRFTEDHWKEREHSLGRSAPLKSQQQSSSNPKQRVKKDNPFL